MKDQETQKEMMILSNALAFLNRCQLDGKESDAHFECKTYLSNKLKALDETQKAPIAPPAKVEK